MTGTRYLVHGVFWDGAPSNAAEYDGGTPVMRLQSPSGDFREVSLQPGARLGFRVAGGRFCLGHHKVLEDMVTREAGLVQQVRSAAKAAALTCPSPEATLDRINAGHAARARALLAQAAVEGFDVVDERNLGKFSSGVPAVQEPLF